jgi:hypothetical protein
MMAAALAASGCENNAIGRVCDVQSDASITMATFNPQALECPSRVCVKPSKDGDLARQIDTTSLCTAECSKDSDCDDSETRNASNPRDKRCRTGFVCGIAFEVGPLCCKKLCICKDFKNIPPSGLPTPAPCTPAMATGTCPNVKK